MGLYVITGGLGFVGSALASHLRTAGHDVVVASRSGHRNIYDGWIEYDLKIPETVNNIKNLAPDGVFHLAWSTTPATAELAPASDINTNLAGSINLLDHMSKMSGIRVVLASSGGAVYGETGNFPVAESHQPNPIGIYGMTKYAMELYASRCRLFADLDVRVARISNPFGANQSASKMQGAATIFARKILRNETIEIWGDGSIVRDYVDVGDVARGLEAVMMLERDASTSNMIFNVGSGQGLSLVQLIDLLESVTGRTADVRFVKQRTFDVPVNFLSIEKLKAKSTWNPGDLKERFSEFVASLDC